MVLLKLRITAISIVLALAAGLFLSCAGDKPAENADGAYERETSETAEVPGGGYIYPDLYPDLDCKGGDFTFLAPANDWGFYSAIVLESETGDILDDIIYARNRTVEDRFNVKLKEISLMVNEINPKLRLSVQSGEDVYDAAYLLCSDGSTPIGTLITANMLYDLNAVPGLNLEEKWWSQSIRKDSAIGSSKSLHFAFNDVNIFTLQCAWCVFINEDMIKNLGLELPYDLVKGGKWTYDAYYRYMKAGAQLGGADSFKWDANGPAIYGCTSFVSGTRALLTASGESIIAVDAKGMPYLTVETERFYSVCDKIAEMHGNKNSGEYLTANDYGTPFHFEAIFSGGRALMMGGELKAANTFRNMESTFGIVPMPKYEETQDRHYAAIAIVAPALVVPATNTKLEQTGIILDAMAYLSNRDVMPVFFDITMSQKQLRNDESIEMLQIIKDSLLLDVGVAYGWTPNLMDPIVNALDLGNNNAASTIEKQKDKTLANIEKTMELIENKN